VKSRQWWRCGSINKMHSSIMTDLWNTELSWKSVDCRIDYAKK
jgi:hypothetical protein